MIEKGIPDLYKMVITVTRKTYRKFEPKITSCRKHWDFSNDKTIFASIVTSNDELFIYLFTCSLFNVDNYRTNTVYNKNSSKMLINVNTVVKNPEHNKFYIKNIKDEIF